MVCLSVKALPPSLLKQLKNFFSACHFAFPPRGHSNAQFESRFELPGAGQIQLSMAPESPDSAAEKGVSPKTPSPSKGGIPRSPKDGEGAPFLDKAHGQAGTTGQNTSESATKPTVSATQAGSYATTKSVGQIALGTALITQVS